MPAAVIMMKTEVRDKVNPESENVPIKQAMVIIEHKIRNLEKRKNKLESYRAIRLSGKELSNDQKTAVAKYDEVAQSLELARDFFKQLGQLSSNYEKEVKKQARKEAILRAQQETAKIKEVLILQQTLNVFENEEAWNDFANGSNGAVKLEQKEIDLLKKFCAEVKTHQITSNQNNDDDAQNEAFQRAAEYLSMTVDGRSKIYYEDLTFENIKELLDKIGNSDYKKSTPKSINEKNCVENQNELLKTAITIQGQIGIKEDTINQGNANVDGEFKSEAPSATILPPPIFSNPEINASDIKYAECIEHSKLNPNLPAEQSLFKEQQIHIRPISEVIGVGNFFFIQDSEIDVPESDNNIKSEAFIIPDNQIQTIQSQTFTNQSMISNGSQNSFQKEPENTLTTLENFDQPQPAVFLKVDSPNASNLPMPGFPALGKTKHDVKNIDNSDKDSNNDWKSQVKEYETSKWTSNEEHKSSNNRPIIRNNLSDRNGNSSRAHMKQNGLRGNGNAHNNYFKNNDMYYNQQGQQGSTNNNVFRARNSRDRGNSYPPRAAK